MRDDHCAEILNHFTEALGLSRYTLYMQDYGGPVGFRMALAHPDRVEASFSSSTLFDYVSDDLVALLCLGFPEGDQCAAIAAYHLAPGEGVACPQVLCVSDSALRAIETMLGLHFHAPCISRW